MTHALTGVGHDASEDGTGRGTPLVVAGSVSGGLGVAGPLMRTGQGSGHRTTDVETQTFVAWSITPEGGQGADLRATEVDLAPAIASTDGARSTDRGLRIGAPAGVRRLTPTECERLQGFPDGWTAPAGLACPDSRRYAALGDAVTVPVAEWIGRRLMAEVLAHQGELAEAVA